MRASSPVPVSAGARAEPRRVVRRAVRVRIQVEIFRNALDEVVGGVATGAMGDPFPVSNFAAAIFVFANAVGEQWCRCILRRIDAHGEATGMIV